MMFGKMKKTQKPKYYGKKVYNVPSIERLRIILMVLMCVYLLAGFPSTFSSALQLVIGFVPIAFFILSGYLVLPDDAGRSDRIVRAIKRTGTVFAVLTAVYFLMNLLYYLQFGVNVFVALASKRFWFEFLALNVWPFSIGDSIWYVQALLYAYVILFFLERWGFLKYDWLIAAILVIFAVVTGEFSGLLPWNVLGYTYLPGNFLSRALPYVLLGGFIQRNMDTFGNIKHFWHWIAIAFGVGLLFLEVWLLSTNGVEGYYGHLIGMPVIATAVCLLGIDGSHAAGFEKKLGMSRGHVNCVYFFCQPVSIAVAAVITELFGEVESAAEVNMISVAFILITTLLCFGIARLIACVDKNFVQE